MTAHQCGAASFIDVLHASETLLQAADARASANGIRACSDHDVQGARRWLRPGSTS